MPNHTFNATCPTCLISAAMCLSLASLTGCHGYRYDTRTTNATNESVRISLYKGKRHVEISSAIAAPGTVVAWTGQTQRPVIVRVEPTNAGINEAIEVSLPRRVHTELTINHAGERFDIVSSVPLASTASHTGAALDDTPHAANEQPAEEPQAASDSPSAAPSPAPETDTATQSPSDTPENLYEEASQEDSQSLTTPDKNESEANDQDPPIDLLDDDDDDN